MNKFLKKILITIQISLFMAMILMPSQGKYDFTLRDYNGKQIKLSDFKGKKAVIVTFVSTRCPVSNAYNDRMEKLNKKYSKVIPFIGINSNRAEATGEVGEHAKEKGLTFPILKDTGNLIADNFKASFTPEVYVLDSSGNLLYHGRIDDSRREAGVKKRDLENALNEIIAGKEVTVKETKAFGCTIKRIKK